MDEALLNICFAGENPHSVDLEPHGIFGSNFADLFILTLSSHWYTNR